MLYSLPDRKSSIKDEQILRGIFLADRKIMRRRARSADNVSSLTPQAAAAQKRRRANLKLKSQPAIVPPIAKHRRGRKWLT
jgi:hypothetical protein